MTREMNRILPLPANEAAAFMQDMQNVLTDVRAQLNELEDPRVLPMGVITFHHVIQLYFRSYESFMMRMGYGNHTSHRQNVQLFEDYMAALPPCYGD
jgi:hypothetical protein